MMNQQIMGCASCILATVLVTGCANSPLRLYSETRDKQGQAAKKAWTEAKVDEVIAVQRQNNVALLDEQVKMEEQAALAKRDTLILALFSAPESKFTSTKSVPTSPSGSAECIAIATGQTRHTLGEFSNAIRCDVRKVAGTESALEQWLENQDALHTFAVKREGVALEFQRVGLEAPACEEIQNDAALEALVAAMASASNKVTVRALLTRAKQICDAEIRRLKAWGESPNYVELGGALAQTRRQLVGDEAAIEDRRAVSRVARNAYRGVAAEFDALVARLGTSKTPEARRQVEEAATKLANAFRNITTIDDAFGARFVAQEKRDTLNAFIEAIADTTSADKPPANASGAARALALMPKLFDQSQSLLADANKPLLVPVVLRRNYEKLNVDAAQRQVDAMETRVALDGAMFDAQLEQAKAYKDALDYITPISEKTKRTRQISDLYTLTEISERTRAINAFAAYFDGKGRLEGQVNQYKFKIAAAKQEEELSRAEVNVKQWELLIGSGVDQLADYGTTGFKPEHITALLNAAALVWIGWRVN